MGVKIPDQPRRPDEQRTIELDEGLEITLTVHHPDIFDQLQIDRYGSKEEYFWQRIQQCIRTWDVQDKDGKPLPLTRPNFERLLLYYPQAFNRFAFLVRDLYYQTEEDVLGAETLGNSETPPPNGGTATSTETTASRSSSGSTIVSSSEPGAEPVLAPTSTP